MLPYTTVFSRVPKHLPRFLCPLPNGSSYSDPPRGSPPPLSVSADSALDPQPGILPGPAGNPGMLTYRQSSAGQVIVSQKKKRERTLGTHLAPPARDPLPLTEITSDPCNLSQDLLQGRRSPFPLVPGWVFHPLLLLRTSCRVQRWQE